MQIEVVPRDIDWEALHSLLISSYAYMDTRIDPPSSLLTMTAEDLERKAADETLIAATSDGALVGCLFCRVEGEWLYVGKMAVAEQLQGSGIGRLLIGRATCLARKQSLAGLELETRIELVENHQVFMKFGFFKVADQSHKGYSRITSIRMRAPLALL